MKYIMLHGLGQSSESWSDTVKVFNDDLKFYALIYQIGFLGKHHVMIHCIGHWKHTVNSLKNR